MLLTCAYFGRFASTHTRARPRVLLQKLAFTLIKVTLEATEYLPNLLWSPQIGQGIGEGVVIPET